MGFQGESALVFDDKSRITIPKEVRTLLATECAGLLTLVRSPDGCLVVYPRPRWEARKIEIMNWPMQARGWARSLLGSALNVEIDSAGRISIPQTAREAVSMGKKVLLRGNGDSYELWDEATYRAYEKQVFEQGWPAELGAMKL